MPTITQEDITKLSRLSKLDYSAPEKSAAMQKELNSILEFVSELKKVNTEGVEPMASTIGGASTREREDAVTDNNDDDTLVAPCAPASEMGFFVVPRVVE